MQHLIFLFLLFLTTLTGCQQRMLDVSTLFFSYQDLASTHAITPDPLKVDTDLPREEVILYWNIPAHLFQSEEVKASLDLRFGNRQEKTITIPISERRDHYTYRMSGSFLKKVDYLVTYKAELYTASGKLLATYAHPLWVDRLTIQEQEVDSSP